MKKIMILSMAIIVLLGTTFVEGAYAGGCGLSGHKSTSSGEIINDSCPVMGGPVDKGTSNTTMYKGKRIGFCCSGCVEAFKKDPEKYIGNIEMES